MVKYYEIYGDEDGGYIREVTKEEVVKMAERGEEFMTSPPHDDSNYWGDAKLIIKGEIVVPRQVNKFDID